MKHLIRPMVIFVFFTGIFFQINAQVRTKTFYKEIPTEMIMNRDSIINEINIPAPESFQICLRMKCPK